MNLLIAILVPAITLVVYGLLVVRRLRAWRLYRDDRARRELLAHIALFIVAVGAAGASALAISQSGTIELRRAISGMAFGSFMAAGILFLVLRSGPVPLNGNE